MPKKGRGRSRSRNFAVIKFSGIFALSTLGNNTVLSGMVTTGVLKEDFYCISADLNASITGLTAGEGHPMNCGLSHSDYSDAQLLENLDNEFLGPGDKIQQEQSRRSVRQAGVLHSEGGLAGSATDLVLIGAGGSRVNRVKCKFLISSGKAMDLWIWNRSGGALTTGSSVRFSGSLYGRWLV